VDGHLSLTIAGTFGDQWRKCDRPFIGSDLILSGIELRKVLGLRSGKLDSFGDWEGNYGASLHGKTSVLSGIRRRKMEYTLHWKTIGPFGDRWKEDGDSLHWKPFVPSGMREGK
jgi:hypothetical protein